MGVHLLSGLARAMPGRSGILTEHKNTRCHEQDAPIPTSSVSRTKVGVVCPGNESSRTEVGVVCPGNEASRTEVGVVCPDGGSKGVWGVCMYCTATELS